MTSKTRDLTIHSGVDDLANANADQPPCAQPALLIGRIEAARLCGISPASWDRLTARAANPAPLRLGGRLLWRRDELTAWVDAGCPDRVEWQAIQDAKASWPRLMPKLESMARRVSRNGRTPIIR